MLKLRVRIGIGRDFFDPVEKWCPDLAIAVVAAEREPITLAYVNVRATGENQFVLDLASDVGCGNHWIQTLRMSPRAAQNSHPPCAGILCGGAGRPCMSAIAEIFAPLGRTPVYVPAEGDCFFFHAALLLTNVRHIGSTGMLNRACLRSKMADWLTNNKGNAKLQLAAT